MLWAAIKNEMQPEARRYLLFFGALLAVALLGGIARELHWLDAAGMQQGMAIVALALIAAFWLMTLVVTTRRFDATAPVGEEAATTDRAVAVPGHAGGAASGSRHHFIQSRLLAAVIWNMAGGALSLLALLPLADTATTAGQIGGAVKALGGSGLHSRICCSVRAGCC
ncbi:MAG: hypothetical protein Q4B48_07250 [Syntrophomonadaceae bacterium]|nr:hypothetical protein [Syntrophomonadaceae bacterium]